MIHHGRQVILQSLEPQPVVGLVHIGGRHIGKLSYPGTDKLPLWIKSLSLGSGVEHPKVGGRIGARSRGPLPATVVGRQIPVDELAHEVILPEPPVDVQILGQETRHYHPQPVVHPAGGVEAAHGGIDYGVAGAPLAPGGKGIRVPAPGQGRRLWLERAIHREGRDQYQQVAIELAPDELVKPDETWLRLGLGPAAEPLLQGRHALTRADDARRQIGGEDGGTRQRRKIPGLAIVQHRLLQEGVQPPQGLGLPYRPAGIRGQLAEHLIDKNPLGQRLPGQRLAPRCRGSVDDEAILIQRLEPGATKGGEDLEHLPRTGQHPPGGQHAAAVEPVATHLLLCQRGGDAMVPALFVQFDGLIGVELGDPELAAEVRQRRRHLGKGLDSQQMELDAEGRQLTAQRIHLGQDEALADGGHLVLPPLGGGNDEECSDRLIAGAAMTQRRVVGKAQVIAKPDQPHDLLLPRPLKPRAAGWSAITSARVARQP
ncbi:hypothetical protein D3C76_519370 [compost metagenome]